MLKFSSQCFLHHFCTFLFNDKCFVKLLFTFILKLNKDMTSRCFVLKSEELVCVYLQLYDGVAVYELPVLYIHIFVCMLSVAVN